jgi:hypothetical protein
MILDQRTSHRVSFFMGGDVYKTADGDRVGRAVVRDASVSGLRIESLVPFQEGETLHLDFTIAGRYQFQRVPALVMRVYRHTGSYLLGLALKEGHDRRRMRQALTFVIESAAA